jgi:hypothetical protein
VVIDVDQGVVLRRIDAAPGRHFYGHGSFTPDGRHLLSSENDYRKGLGVVGVRDATDDYRLVGELPAHGVGPHEVVLMRDGRTLAVANGGIRTHAAVARLSRDRERPAGGRRAGAARAPPARHPPCRGQRPGPRRGRHAVRGPQARPGAAGGARRGRGSPLPRCAGRFSGACASTPFDGSGDLLAVSSPRGSLFTFWDAAAGRLIDYLELFDGCGLYAAEAPGAFLVTGGGGEVIRLEPRAPAASR